MGKKNESIHLWMLEEERRKDRERAQTPEEAIVEIQEEAVAEELGDSAEPQTAETKQPRQAEKTGFEHFEKEKEELEKESLRLDDEIATLTAKAKVLSQNIIREIKKRNTEKRRATSQLQNKINSLEAQLASTHESESGFKQPR